MSFAGFRDSITTGSPPPELSPALLALWHDGRGDWNRAHELAQAAGGREGDWVHAYLHRKEGDSANAGYWYARAGKAAAKGDSPAEWEAIVRALLAVSGK